MRNLKKFLIVCTFSSLWLFWPAALPHPRRRSPPQKHRPRRPLRRPRPRRSHSRLRLRRIARSCARFRIMAGVFSAVQESKAEEDGADVPAYSSALRAAASPEDLTESDILRVDGEYIYTLTDKNLTIFHLSGEAGELISTTPVGTAWSSSGDGSGSSCRKRTHPARAVPSRLTARRSPGRIRLR